MRIAGTNPNSLVNGPGIRYVIFTQGCPHHCDGCHNPETWDPTGGIEVAVSTIYRDICNRKGFIDGVTISGGEPFLHEKALVQLLKDLRYRWEPRPLSVWLYTGYKYEDICDSELAKLVDVIVDGQFEKEKRTFDGELYGSTNQRIIDVKGGKIYKHGEL